MRQQVKRVVAIIMTVAMLVGLFPLEVFAQNSQGEPLNRGSITAAIHALAPLAHLPPAQCNLRSLHRLYQDTREAMAKELAYLVEQMHERLLEQEEMTIGWRESTPPDADDS